jgi:hypothetical protein
LTCLSEVVALDVVVIYDISLAQVITSSPLAFTLLPELKSLKKDYATPVPSPSQSPAPSPAKDTNGTSPSLHLKVPLRVTNCAAKCLVLSSTDGVLSLLLCNDSMDGLPSSPKQQVDVQEVPLANYVEQFWVANYTSESERDLGNTLWAYGQVGLQVGLLVK